MTASPARTPSSTVFVVAVTFATLATVATSARRASADEIDACIDASDKAVAFAKADKLIEERASLSACTVSNCPDAIRSSCQQRLTAVNLC